MECERQDSTERARPSVGLILLSLLLIFAGAWIVGTVLSMCITLRTTIEHSFESLNDLLEADLLLFFYPYICAIALFMGFYVMILGFKVMRLRAWTYRALLLITAPNMLFALNTFLLFGPKAAMRDLNATATIVAMAFWLFVFLFVLREKTQKQFRYGSVFAWWSVPGACVVAVVIVSISPAAMLLGYKLHLTHSGVPFWPVSNKVHEVNREDPPQLANCQEARFLKICFPLRKDLRLRKFVAESGGVRDIVALSSKKEGNQRRQAAMFAMSTPYNDLFLQKLMGAENACEMMETIMTANWSLLPLLIKNVIGKEATHVYSWETDNLKIIAWDWQLRRDDVFSVLLYVPSENISREILLTMHEGRVFGHSMPAILSKMRYLSEFSEGDAVPPGGAGDLWMLEVYMNHPTTENAILLAERLIGNDITGRKEIRRFLEQIVTKDADNKKVAELLAHIGLETEN